MNEWYVQCNAFNEYFSSIGSKINNSINNINKNDFKEFLSNNFNSFYFLPIDNDEIIKVTKDIKSKRSLDINNHDMTLIKDIIQYILEPLKKIFNLSIQTNTFPDNMKIIKIYIKLMINNKYPINGQFHYYQKYQTFLKKLFLIDYQNIYLSIILLTKINMVLFPNLIQPYHY